MNLKTDRIMVVNQIRFLLMIKMNVGCGWRNFGDDWIHVDGGDYEHLDHKDIHLKSHDDESVDLIYSSHVIEYFDRDEIITLLSNWHRVLKPNGILRVAVPDFSNMTWLYQNGKITLDQILGPLYGKMKMGDETIYHKTVYDYDSLSSLLQKCGFKDVFEYEWRETDHAEHDDHSQASIPHMDKENGTLISLNIEASK